MVLLAAILYICLVWCLSVAPRQSQYSAFERTRRLEAQDIAIAHEIRRAETYDVVAGMLRLAGLLVTVGFSWTVLAEFGWAIGTIAVVAGILAGLILSRVAPVRRLAQRLYDRYEVALLGFIEQHRGVLQIVRAVNPQRVEAPQVASKEEFIHISDSLITILTKDERRLVRQGLSFSEVKVGDIMTPRSVMESVKKDDIIGPLLLDELHKTGHSRFPVIDKDIDHVIGILHIRNLLQLQDKKTHEASSVMTKPVHYVNEVQTANHALAAFLRTHCHLMIAVNEYRETV